MRTILGSKGERWLVLTDANYGTEFPVRADHITGASIVSHQTYRDGMIPDGAFRHTVLYTLGGSQFAVRESPTEIVEEIAR